MTSLTADLLSARAAAGTLTGDRVADAIGRYPQRLDWAGEAALLDSIKRLLAALRVPAETRDGPGGAASLVVHGSVVVVAGACGSSQDLTARLLEHVARPPVTGVVLVTARSAHRAVPPQVGGVPVHVVWLPGR